MKTHSVAIERSGDFILRYHVYVSPGHMASRNWHTVMTPATTCNTLAEAQEWLKTHIGVEAQEYEIHRRL